MRATRRLCSLFAFVAIVTGLPPGVHGQVIESAGIPIVTSDMGDAVYAEVSEQPALSIGGLDGPNALWFDRIEWVARDSEGNVIVADGGSQEIRVFDSEGNHLRTMGGKGEGPGEFQSLRGVWPVGDGSVVAVEMYPPRLAHFDATGRVVETANLTDPDLWQAFTVLDPVGLGGGRSIVSSVERAQEDSREPVRPPVPFVRHGFDGTLLDTIAVLPGRPESSVALPPARTPGSRIGMPGLPLTSGPRAAGSADGMAITGGEAYEVRFVDRSGTITHIARLVDEPPPRTDEHIEAYARAATILGEEMIQERIEWFRNLPLPPRLPGYDRLLFADTSELWARRYGVPGSSSHRWDVFTVDGRHLGQVQVPAGLRVHGVSHGQLFGVVRDDLDVERVQAWDLALR